MKYYSVYQITNLINNKIYIGYHVTDNLNDDYMGSNTHLKNSINKYGFDNFKKETLFILNSYEAMVDKEKELVNEDFVKREDTYNKNLGGKGGFYYLNQNYEEFNEKKKKSYQDTLNNTDLRSRISNSVSNFAKNNPEKIKESNRKATESRMNKSEKEKDVIRNKKRETSFNFYYNTDEGLISRENKSKQLTEYYQSEKRSK